MVSWFKKFFMAITLLALASCGGIDGTGRPGEGSIQVTSVGTVDGFGSVIMNGVKFETDDTDFSIDDASGNQSQLSVGQVVVVRGTLNDDLETGVAEQISYVSRVLGPVDSIDMLNGSLLVLGQQVNINDATVFGTGLESLATLSNGDVVRVSGFLDSQNKLIATYIDVQSTTDYIVTAAINNIDRDAKTFTLNDLIVSYASTELPENIADLDEIVVKGNEFTLDQYLIATQVTDNIINLGTQNNKVDIEGYITEFTSVENFGVNGIEVTADSNTVYENGVPEDIGLNSRVEIEGTATNDGSQVIAEKIIILSTEALTVNGQIGVQEKLVYTLSSTEADRGLWVEVTNISSSVSLYVNEGGEVDEYWMADCASTAYVTRLQRFCYVENTAATTWTIVIESATGSAFQLRAFFGRSPLSDPIDLTNNQPEVFDVFAGDRRIYRLPADTTKSIVEFSMGGTNQDFHYYIMPDRQPSSGTYQCKQTVKQGEYKACFLNNTAVNDWYIVVEGAFDGQYNLQAGYSEPIEIEPGVTVSHKIERGASLYRISSNADHASIATALNGLSDDVDMKVRGDLPPTNVADCANQRKGTNSEQCIVDNETATDWYILLEGNENAEYDITANLVDEQPELVTLNPGDEISITQAAGVRATYKVLPAADGTIFTPVIRNKTAPYILKASKNVEYERYPACNAYGLDLDESRCFLENDTSVEAWYLTVESAEAGSYTLSVDFLEPKVLTAGNVMNATVEDPVGGLFQLESTALDNSVYVILSNVDNNARFFMRPELLASSTWDCGHYESNTREKSCVRRNTKATTWYFWVDADIGTSFSLLANTQTILPDTQLLTSGQSITDTSEAGVLHRYVLSADTDKTVLSTLLSNMDDSFELYINRDPIDLTKPQNSKYRDTALGTKDKFTHLPNEADIENWYVLVQSAYSGSYELLLEHTQPIALNNETIEGVIENEAGMIYQFDALATMSDIQFTLTELTGNIGMKVKQGTPPSIATDCIKNSNSALDKECAVMNTTTQPWYIVVFGEVGESFSLQAITP